jgi:hypothetical protein
MDVQESIRLKVGASWSNMDKGPDCKSAPAGGFGFNFFLLLCFMVKSTDNMSALSGYSICFSGMESYQNKRKKKKPEKKEKRKRV